MFRWKVNSETLEKGVFSYSFIFMNFNAFAEYETRKSCFFSVLRKSGLKEAHGTKK